MSLGSILSAVKRHQLPGSATIFGCSIKKGSDRFGRCRATAPERTVADNSTKPRWGTMLTALDFAVGSLSAALKAGNGLPIDFFETRDRSRCLTSCSREMSLPDPTMPWVGDPR